MQKIATIFLYNVDLIYKLRVQNYGNDTHKSKGRIQRPVGKAVMKKIIQLLLKKLWYDDSTG